MNILTYTFEMMKNDFKVGVPHYTKDGKLYTGPTHKDADGRLMTGAVHSEDSEYLYHEGEFKIPVPNPGESRNEYVSRCMDAIGGENKPHDQLVAICEVSYTNK